MNAPELTKHLREQPFVPLRLHMSDGSSFDIRHPENAIVTTQTIYVVTHEDPKTGVAEDVQWLSLRQLVRVEQRAAASSESNN